MIFFGKIRKRKKPSVSSKNKKLKHNQPAKKTGGGLRKRIAAMAGAFSIHKRNTYPMMRRPDAVYQGDRRRPPQDGWSRLHAINYELDQVQEARCRSRGGIYSSVAGRTDA